MFDIKELEKLIRICKVFKISGLVFEKDRIRGIDELNRLVVFHETKTGFGIPFAIRDLSVKSSLLCIQSLSDKQTTITTYENNGYANALFLNAGDSGGVIVGCNPILVRAPKVINDTIQAYIPIHNELKNLVIGGMKSGFGERKVEITSTPSGVFGEMEDLWGDRMTFDIYKPIKHHFNFRYEPKILRNLLRLNHGGKFGIGAKGIFSIVIDGFQLYMLPAV